MNKKNRIIKSLAGGLMAVLLSQILSVPYSLESASPVSGNAGQVSACEVTSDKLMINASIGEMDPSVISEINAYSVPVYENETTLDYSLQTKIGTANLSASSGVNQNDHIVLGDFENALTDGWIAGNNTGSILSTIKDTMSADFNSPSYPAQGGYFLQATKSASPATTKSYVLKNLATPLDLSGYQYINYDFFGWAGTSTAYYIDMILTAADYSTRTYTIQCTPGIWMANYIDISGYAGRNQISSIKFAYYGSDLSFYSGDWTGCFSLDGIQAAHTTNNASGIINPAASSIVADFETGLDGFVAGTNTSSIAKSAFSNNSNCLDATKDGVVPTEASTIRKTFNVGSELNLSQYKLLSLDVANWGGAAEKYAYQITVASKDGSSYTAKRYGQENTWNTLMFDLSSFEGRNAISWIQIAFFCEGAIVPEAAGGWAGHFFIDNITVYTNVGRINDFEYGSVNGWSAGSNIYPGSFGSSSGIVPYPTKGSCNQNFLIGQKTGTPDSISVLERNYGLPLNLGNFSIFEFDFFCHGGASLTETYKVDLVLSSGGNTRTYSKTIGPNTWHNLQFAMDDFSERNAITQIRVEFNALDANPAIPEWNGAFMIDNIRIAGVGEEKFNGTLDTNGNIQFAIPLADIPDINKKYVVLITKINGDIQLVDVAKYVTNPGVLAANKEDYPASQSVKGLQVQLNSDAERLGIKHAGYNIALNGLLTLTDHGVDTIQYIYENKTYYFKKAVVQTYDTVFSDLTANKITTNAILIMYPTDLDNPDSPNKDIVHPDAVHKTANIIDAINLTNQTGVEYYSAMISFLSKRYNGDNKNYGRINGYIVGNEIGAECWNSMGEKPVDEYIRQYERQLRLTNTIAKQAWSNARVYVSLDHFWAMKGYTYYNNQIVSLINQYSKQGGDYDWNVAFHPYPENLFDPRTWNDATATDDFNTGRITFKNIQVLPRFLKQQEYLYNNQSRRIILSEQGFNTPSLSEQDQNLQAAAYAYAYYKIASIPEIDAFLLHRHVDHEIEGGLNLGLWTTIAGQVSQASEQKKIYQLFKSIDTVDSLYASDFALDVIGADIGSVLTNWNQIIPEFDINNIQSVLNRPTVRIVPCGTPGYPTNVEILSSGTLDKWTANDNTSNAVLAFDGDLYKFVLTASVNGLYYKEFKGLTYTPVTPMSFETKPVLKVDVKATSIGVGKTVEFMIRAYSGDRVVEGSYIGNGNVWNTIGMDLSGFEGIANVDRIKVWARSVENNAWSSGTISINNLSRATTADFSGNKTMSSFEIMGMVPNAKGIIHDAIIDVTVPFGTLLTNLTANFEAKGATVKIGQTTQISGITVNNFTNPLTYTLIAGDFSTKTYTVNIRIADKPAQFLQNTMLTGNRIGKIEPGTLATAFKSGIKMNATTRVEIKNPSGTILGNSDFIGTDTWIDIKDDGETVNTYRAVVYGDLTGNGQIEIADLAAMKSHLLKFQLLNEVKQVAGDVLKKGTISISDLVAMKKHLLGTYHILQS